MPVYELLYLSIVRFQMTTMDKLRVEIDACRPSVIPIVGGRIGLGEEERERTKRLFDETVREGRTIDI
jgi:hypothetical protein